LISDFGEVQAENIVRKSTGATGTISYCAPEVLKKDSTGRYANFTTKSDIFSLGMILYFMCFGRLPYSSADSIQEEFEDLDMLRAEISTWSGFKDERQERPDLPDQLYEFLIRLLAINPLERPGAEEILHAIRTESGLDSPPRVGRKTSANGNLRLDLGIGKRIQPLDTPVLGTPEPRSNSRPPFATPEDPDHDRRERTTISPPPKPISIDLPPKEPSKDFIARRDRSQAPPTPLLMPPPSTPLSSFQHQIAVYLHHVFSWAVHNHHALSHGAKLVIFVIKMYALTKPCMPLATDPFIAYPLLLLAALELALGRAIEWRLSGISLVVHFIVLALMAKMNRLCANGRAEWEW
jgi:serine/threonine protein kinase